MKQTLPLSVEVRCPECRNVLQRGSKLKFPLDRSQQKQIQHEDSIWYLECTHPNCSNQRRYELPSISLVVLGESPE